MANQWLRLWHDMPNDPKWRTISRVSGQPITVVISVYVHLLVDASRNVTNVTNVTRGHVYVTNEDLASALDVTEEAVFSVLSAMQGRVMDGNYLSGWDQRQVKREDDGNPETGARTAAQRKREQREREKLAAKLQQENKCHDESRDVTRCHDREEKRREEVNPSLYTPIAPIASPTRKGAVCGLLRQAGMQDSAPHYLTDEVWETILAKRTDEEIIEVAKAKMAARPNDRIGLKYIAKALLQDPEAITAAPMGHGPPRMSHADKSKLAAARAIFGTEIEGNQHDSNSRIIDVTPAATPILGG